MRTRTQSPINSDLPIEAVRILDVEIYRGKEKIGFTDWGEYSPEGKTMKVEDVRWKVTPSVSSTFSVRGNMPDGSLFAHDMTLTHQTNNFSNCWFN